MDEYISKHEAYTLMKDLEAAYIYPPVKEAYGTAARRIDQMSSVDVQPVVHGRWIWDSNAPHREHGAYKCSNCGCHSDFEENYCYNCGARMDGDAK